MSFAGEFATGGQHAELCHSFLVLQGLITVCGWLRPAVDCTMEQRAAAQRRRRRRLYPEERLRDTAEVQRSTT